MQVFISHSFDDAELASTLKDILKEKNITGIMAQRVKEYEILIRDKIKTQISESDYVVAVITQSGYASASVNQEIGFAMGRDIPVIAMFEEKEKHQINPGVLTHGVDLEPFTRQSFSDSCHNVQDYLLRKGTQITKGKMPSEAYLKQRNLINTDQGNLGLNAHSQKLYDFCGISASGARTPLVLFSACPAFLLDDIPLTDRSFTDWLASHRQVKFANNVVNFIAPDNRRKIELDSIVFHSLFGEKGTIKYTELDKNGFIEQGFTYPLVLSFGAEGKQQPFLNLGYLTLSFWAFLTFSRDYYTYLKLGTPVDVIMTIRNSSSLVLGGFGGKTSGGTWAEPYSGMAYFREIPKTDTPDISIVQKLTLHHMPDEQISTIARRFSERVSNAYGLDFPRCYNDDGTLVSEYFRSYDV